MKKINAKDVEREKKTSFFPWQTAATVNRQKQTNKQTNEHTRAKRQTKRRRHTKKKIQLNVW